MISGARSRASTAGSQDGDPDVTSTPAVNGGDHHEEANEEPEADEASRLRKWPLFLLNLGLTLLYCGINFNDQLIDQYVYYVSAHALAGDDIPKTSSNPCPNETTVNSSQRSLVADIQSLTSTRLLYLDLTTYGTAIFTIILLGAYSNVLNRKLVLFIPAFGRLIRYVTTPIVVYWKLDFSWLFLGYVVDGLSGSLAGIYLGSFLYTSDITPRDSKRTLGVIIVESVKAIVTSTLFIITGHLIQKSGFLPPTLISVGLTAASIVVILLLPNCQPRHSVGPGVSRWSPVQAWNTIRRPFGLHNGRRVRKMIILGTLAFFLTLIWHAGVIEIRSLLFMNVPFCWDAVTIGWFSFGRQFAAALFMLISTATLQKYLPGMMLGILGVVSYIASLLLFAFAMEDYQLYIAPVVSAGQYLPIGIVRGELSRLLDSSQQGPMFAALAVVESFSFALSSGYLYVYKATLSDYPRPIFLISVGIAVSVLVIFIWFQKLWKKHNVGIQYHKVDADDSGMPGPTEKVV